MAQKMSCQTVKHRPTDNDSFYPLSFFQLGLTLKYIYLKRQLPMPMISETFLSGTGCVPVAARQAADMQSSWVTLVKTTIKNEQSQKAVV